LNNRVRVCGRQVQLSHWQDRETLFALVSPFVSRAPSLFRLTAEDQVVFTIFLTAIVPTLVLLEVLLCTGTLSLGCQLSRCNRGTTKVYLVKLYYLWANLWHHPNEGCSILQWRTTLNVVLSPLDQVITWFIHVRYSTVNGFILKIQPCSDTSMLLAASCLVTSTRIVGTFLEESWIYADLGFSLLIAD
jgi:hypothetical protein